MKIHFITGNNNKYEEARKIIPELEQLDIDLPEIQSLDPKEILKAKLTEALNHHPGEFVVEDTGLYIKGLNGLPGPLVKWFLKTMGNEGIYQMSKAFNNLEAEAKTVLGYAKNRDEIYFFEGVVEGEIVKPRGDEGFGFDPIFQPKGKDKTFAQISREEKNELNMRGMAFKKLKEFLEEEKHLN